MALAHKSPRPPVVRNSSVLREAYRELAADRLPYFKTIFELATPTGSFEEILVTNHPVDLRVGDEYKRRRILSIRGFEEETVGALYAPGGAGRPMLRFAGTEWALNLVCDIDLARKRGKDVRAVLRQYLATDSQELNEYLDG